MWVFCHQKWHELWLDDAYWHVLFCVILVVIVILFRPTANNQRYAFSPLTDRDEDDESKEPMMNDAFGTDQGRVSRNLVQLHKCTCATLYGAAYSYAIFW